MTQKFKKSSVKPIAVGLKFLKNQSRLKISMSIQHAYLKISKFCSYLLQNVNLDFTKVIIGLCMILYVVLSILAAIDSSCFSSYLKIL